ncbi:MAG: hypothetical protein AAF565_20750, partial [Pseudomonadota bacterium]
LVAAYQAKDWTTADACLHRVFQLLAQSNDWRAPTLRLDVTAELYAGRLASRRIDPETGVYPEEADSDLPVDAA